MHSNFCPSLSFHCNPCAAGGQDFSTIDGKLNFGPNKTRNCFFIFIINDEECEASPNEQFTVVLSHEDQRLVIIPSVLTIAIDDIGTFLSATDIDCCKWVYEKLDCSMTERERERVCVCVCVPFPFLSPLFPDPLEIYFTGDTPAIDGDEITALLATRGRSLPQTISCDLRKNGVLIQTQDCEWIHMH